MQNCSSLFAGLLTCVTLSRLANPASPALAGEPYPQTVVTNTIVSAALYLPDSERGYYRGTRFDWSGLVSHVEVGGHSFFCDFKQQHDPLNHDDICGTAEEFGIESAPSYAEASPGEPFIKIGIGVLEKPDASPYAFWKRYNVLKPGDWKILAKPDNISFRQHLEGPKGWGYIYTKTLTTVDQQPVLKIRRELKNTGTRRIQTDHYDHNFLRIDNLPAGTNYTLEFPFTPHLGKDSRTEGLVEIRGKALCFMQEPTADKAIWVRLEGFTKPEDNRIRVVNHASGAAMNISTDRPLSKLVFYSSGGVLCPEAFVDVDLGPGQSQEWTTTYRFDAGNQRRR
jgi:hypothetical protein